MDGFQDEIKRQLLFSRGEVAVLVDESYNGDVDVLRKYLENVSDVVSVTSFYETYLLLSHSKNYAFPLACGIGDTYSRGYLRDSITLSSSIAEQLQVVEGDEILALSPEQVVRNLDGKEVIFPTELFVEGIHSAKMGDAYRNRVFMPIETLSALCMDGIGVTGFELRLSGNVDVVTFAKSLRDNIQFGGVRVVTWLESNGSLLSALSLERAAMFFSMAFIVVIAAFATGSFLSSHVTSKAREIGLLRALGCTRVAIALCFFLQSIIIGVAGICIGLLTSTVLLIFRDNVLRCVLKIFGGGEHIFDFYDFVRLPIAVHCAEIVKICAFSLITTIFAGVLPVVRTLRVDSSTVLRKE
jgi:lipoprotein-releasing system permease protein